MGFRSIYGIDLGTSAIKIYSLRKNSILVEKNMIAMLDGEPIAVGDSAYKMYEKTPDHITVSSPIMSGTIANIRDMEIVLHTLLHKMEHHVSYWPALYFSVPTNMSKIEKRAYAAIAHGGGLRSPSVYLLERPIADAIALGIPLHETQGSMIVNMGARNVELSIISNENVIISKTIPVGGRMLNDRICDEIRRKNNLLIGKRTARRLKEMLANLEEEKKEARKIIGLNTLSGLPRESIISSALITKAISAPLMEVASEIHTFIERIPPQIAQNVIKEGIYLTGGTTRIPGIDRFLEKQIEYPVKLSYYYEMCTIKGLEELITHKQLHHWAHSIKEMKL